MQQINDFKIAISTLRSTKASLKALFGELNLISENYKNSINIAKKNKFFESYIEQLELRYNERNIEIKDIKVILNNFISKIDKHIDVLIDLEKTANSGD